MNLQRLKIITARCFTNAWKGKSALALKKKMAGVLSTEGLHVSTKTPQSQLASCEMRSVWLDWGEWKQHRQPQKSAHPTNPLLTLKFRHLKIKNQPANREVVCTGRVLERSEVCTVAASLRLCGLPVHGPLHGFLPSGEAELALWQDDITGQAWRGPLASETGSIELLTVRVDLRLVLLTHDLQEVTGPQVPHVHPLGCPRCHGRTQSRGLRHGGSHWTHMGHEQSI